MNTPRDANVGAAEQTAWAGALREVMVRELCEQGWIRSERVADAFRTVPRHLFAPGTSLETAYATHNSVVTKSDEQGKATSVVSAPYIQAMMVEQAGISPGMRVLEIGSGGYNAALIAELVGEAGEVTTVDIDPDVVDRARSCLMAAGYNKISLVVADAEGGVPEHAPYDRMKDLLGVQQPLSGRQRLPSAEASHDGVARRSVASARTIRSERMSPSSRLRCRWISDDAQSARRAGSRRSR